MEGIVGRRRRGDFLTPPWAVKLRLPGEKEVEEGAGRLRTGLQLAEDQLEKFRYFKALLTEQGPNLEEVVSSAFELLGMPLSRPATTGAGTREDFVYLEAGCRIPIEVRGHKKGMEEKDLNQLISRLGEAHQRGNNRCRGILVGNPLLEEEPAKRRHAFETSLVEKALPWELCLLSTGELLEAVTSALRGEGKAKEFKTKLLDTVGEFRWN